MATSRPVMLLSEQIGASSTSSLTRSDTVTVTSCPLGGQMRDGVAEIESIVGAVVSAATTTLTDWMAKLPAASVQVSVNTYVRPLTARTVPVCGPSMEK